MRIMGIDPGSRIIGIGCVEKKGNQFRCVGYEAIKIIQQVETEKYIPERLGLIFEAIQLVVEAWQPHSVAIESVFHAKNVQSAIKLGQARGAAICAVALEKIPIHEYAPRLIKQSVSGDGSASKEQVQKMVCMILGLSETIQNHDASDALAIALCHAQHWRPGMTQIYEWN